MTESRDAAGLAATALEACRKWNEQRPIGTAVEVSEAGWFFQEAHLGQFCVDATARVAALMPPALRAVFLTAATDRSSGPPWVFNSEQADQFCLDAAAVVKDRVYSIITSEFYHSARGREGDGPVLTETTSTAFVQSGEAWIFLKDRAEKVLLSSVHPIGVEWPT